MPPEAPATNSRDASKISSLVPLLLDWFARNARDLPWRRARDPYAIWVSEIMLQQTQVKTVVPYWERWMRDLPTIQALATASSDNIHKLWEGLGYYTRVRNLQKAARMIIEKHNGSFPTRFEDVLDLPGIGRYTAGAICSIAFNQPTPILDGNVIRVLTRLFAIRDNPREKSTNARLWKLAGDFVLHASRSGLCSAPARQVSPHARPCSALNQSLMELGAMICTPHRPQCNGCPVATQCLALRRGLVEDLPNLGSRPAATVREFVAFVLRRNGSLFVRQRPAGTVNAHLWEFPNVELTVRKASIAQAAQTILNFPPTDLRLLCTIKHSITRYRITLHAFELCPGPFPKAALAGRWVKLSKLETLSFPSAHKKVLEHLLRR